MTDWAKRFAEFVARKEREAAVADLCAYKTDVDQHDASAEPIGNAWSSRLFDGPLYASPWHMPDLPTTNLVFVQSRDRNTGARNPTLLGGGDTDKHLIYEGLSRVAADAVLSGAETIRGGHLIFSTWRPELMALRESKGLPRHPIQIVATLRGMEFDDALIFNVPDLRVVLLTVQKCSTAMRPALARRPWITPVVMNDAHDLAGGFRQLRRLGVERISCVGGRTLARQLLDAGLIQDLYLTTSAKNGGEPNTPLYPAPLKGNLVVRKHGTGRDDGVVFEHFAL
jgi:5-amino-6-(5-phosphoribosylamino)uracil reductase